MAEELLDEADVGSAFEHVGGAGVTQEVAASGAAEVGFFDELAHHAAEDVGVEAFAVAGEEEGFFVLGQGEFGANFFEVFLQPMKGAVSDGGDAVFVAFAFSDLEGLAVLVEVGEFEFGEFAATKAAGVEELEDGAIPDAERVADVGDVEELPDLLVSEGLFGKPFLLAREFEFAGGVGEDEVLSGEVFEVVLEGAEAGALRADAEGLAVVLAVSPKVPLVAFEDGLGDLVGLVQVALVAPIEEDFESVLAGFDGAFAVVLDGEGLEVAKGFGGEAAALSFREVSGAVAASFVGVASPHAVRCVVSLLSCHDYDEFCFEGPDVRFHEAAKLSLKPCVAGDGTSRGRFGEGARSAPLPPRSGQCSVILKQRQRVHFGGVWQRRGGRLARSGLLRRPR